MRFIVLPLLLALSTILQAQQQTTPHRCSATEIHHHHYDTDPNYRHNYDVNKIELEAIKAASANQVRLDCTSPLIIPVAVHYEGVTNQTAACLEALALSQIEVLNADFSASNTDIANYCDDVDNSDLDPAALATNGACIQFCLATQNHPSGFGLSNGDYAITTGQDYVANNSFPNFTLGVWAGYLNIFVTEGTGVLGYAPLFGSANGDGVVIEACVFGVQGNGCGNGIGPGSGCANYSTYNLGRTATHEVGHYLGLNHIWGDGDCGADDGFVDTPTSAGEYFGCPAQGVNSCGTDDMYMNYMDYVNDACMYMFSEEQATTMYNAADVHWGTTTDKCSATITYPVATLPGGCDPAVNDAGVIAHASPVANSTSCSVGTSITPVVTLQNIGSATLTSAAISYEINAGAPVTMNWTGSLVTGATEDVTLAAYNEPAGIYEFKSYTSNPNGTADEQPNNDEFATNHQAVVPQNLPYQEDFEDGSFNPTNSGLNVVNPSGDNYTWVQGNVSANGAGNFAALFDNYSGTPNANPGGTNDILTTPVFDFSGVAGAVLTFDVAYAIYDATAFDSLAVSVSTDCGNTFDQIIFLDGNTDLATAPANTNLFTPTASEWNNISLDLSAFDNLPNVTISFINYSGWGNSMYIDNINITIPDPQNCTVTATSTGATCAGNDGTATAVPANTSGTVTYNWSNNGSTATITGLTPNDYTVTITDAAGCTNTAVVTVADNCNCGDFIASSSIVDNASCNGICDGIAFAQANGGDGNYSYIWNNGFTQPTQTNLCAGDYTVTISDGSGCTDVTMLTITEPTPLVASASIVNDPSCNGVCDGTITVQADGGTGNYSYIWENGFTQATQTDLCAGSYTVTISDANGCSATTMATLIEPTAITISTTSTPETCDGNDGTATVTGSGNLTYQWSNGMSGTSISNLSAGNYTVIATDANTQCTASETVFVANDCGCDGSLTYTLNSIGDAGCQGVCGGFIDGVGSAGNGSYSYIWSTGEITAGITGLCAGDYSVTVFDANQCSYSETFTITEFPTVTFTTTSSPETCDAADGSATAIPSGNATYSYAWNTGATTASISNLAAGDYTVTLTDINTQCTASETVTVANDCGCDGSLTYTLNSIGDAGCQGVCGGFIDGVGSAGNGSYSYIWSTGEITAGITGLCAGDYSVTVFDANQCSYSETFTITEFPTVTFTTTSSPETCDAADGSATAIPSGNATYSYAWNTGATTASISNLAAGDYTVTLTDVNTQCTASETVTVANNCGCDGSLDYNANVMNSGCPGVCDGSIIGMASNGAGNYVYEWSTGQTSPSLNALCAGTYTVTVYDANQCSHIETFSIGEDPAVAFTVSTTDETCNGNDGTATATGNGNISFSWSNGDTGNTATGFTAGVYTVTGVDNTTGCSSLQTFTIVQDCPGCNLTISTSILNGSCSGQCDASVTVSSNSSNVVYEWSNGFTGNTISNLCPGIYDVTATDPSNCTATGSVTITQPEPIQLDIIGNDANCGPQSGSVSTSVSGGTAPFSYIWSTGETTSAINGLGAGIYEVTVTDINNCTATNEVLLNELQLLSITGFVTNTTCNGDTDGAVNVTVDGGLEPFTFNWGNGAVTEDLENVPAGNYVLVVTDANNCSSGTSFTVAEPDEIFINMTVVDANNGSNGSIVAGTSGGNAPYSWQWSDGSSGIFNNNLSAGDYTVFVTDSNGCTASATATVGNTTSTLDPTLVTDWSIHPNPSNGLFFLSMELVQTEEVSIRVINVIGQTVYESKHHDSSLNQAVDLQQFAGGTYFMEIKVRDSRVVEKLMIAR